MRRKFWLNKTEMTFSGKGFHNIWRKLCSPYSATFLNLMIPSPWSAQWHMIQWKPYSRKTSIITSDISTKKGLEQQQKPEGQKPSPVIIDHTTDIATPQMNQKNQTVAQKVAREAKVKKNQQLCWRLLWRKSQPDRDLQSFHPFAMSQNRSVTSLNPSMKWGYTWHNQFPKNRTQLLLCDLLAKRQPMS